MNAQQFRQLVLRFSSLDALLDEVAEFALPDAWIVAGCLTQTIWNLQTGHAHGYGIGDYDVFYFDPDLSWEAEDRVIARMRPVAERLGLAVEVRNQARVHLWYTTKHGTPYPSLSRSTDGIDHFLTRCTQIGIRRTRSGDDIYAPFDFDDLEQMIVRPNTTANFSASAYVAKAARWKALWPKLTVLPPPETMVAQTEGSMS
ncbi:MAG: nucleotidyltransferase family protein [Xanthobacteraceae bacterium]